MQDMYDGVPVGTKIFVGSKQAPLGTLIVTKDGLQAIGEPSHPYFDRLINDLPRYYPSAKTLKALMSRLQRDNNYYHQYFIVYPPQAETLTIQDVIPSSSIIIITLPKKK